LFYPFWARANTHFVRKRLQKRAPASRAPPLRPASAPAPPPRARADTGAKRCVIKAFGKISLDNRLEMRYTGNG
jgi:hypothetical protein